MKLVRGYRPIAEFSQGTVVTIGNFDGVHRGHQALLKFLSSKALQLKLPLVVVLFEPQPIEYLDPTQAVARLSSLREKIIQLRKQGVNYVYCLKFDSFLSQMRAKDFAEKILFSQLHAQYLSVGHDFRFGYQREGDIHMLQEIGQKNACEIKLFSDFYIYNQRVSSTSIRHLLQHNELAKAALFLGRQYTLCGRVICGKGLGAQWGIPTANINLRRLVLPIRGVFYVQVIHKNKTIKGVANIGRRPTVGGTKDILEVHLLNFNGCLYGEFLEIFFLEKLRDEMKFPNIEALILQIHKDITIAKALSAE